MAFEIDPVYHTEAMVRILRDQGSTVHAAELAELILGKQEAHLKPASLNALLQEMREDLKKNFDKFRAAGRAVQAEPVVLKQAKLPADKIQKLQSLLSLVQARQNNGQEQKN